MSYWCPPLLCSNPLDAYPFLPFNSSDILVRRISDRRPRLPSFHFSSFNASIAFYSNKCPPGHSVSIFVSFGWENSPNSSKLASPGAVFLGSWRVGTARPLSYHRAFGTQTWESNIDLLHFLVNRCRLTALLLEQNRVRGVLISSVWHGFGRNELPIKQGSWILTIIVLIQVMRSTLWNAKSICVLRSITVTKSDLLRYGYHIVTLSWPS